MKSSLKVKLLTPMSAMLAMFAIVVLAMLFTLHTLESQFVELKDKKSISKETPTPSCKCEQLAVSL
ncbi:hypothetical protein [Pseudoalteromonas rubra]|uniref:hypothetical protein n=1 Tax=Pseudoalteromonas rubra TaxID=43658 RepID=UPI002DBDC733|nr:hypothetical protein [Pseudoalteromonas rubra]MEC4090523.1 hypothetical protein [Pseudoalteromonas rubra]